MKFENEKTRIPKALWWYVFQIGYKGVLNADKCDELVENDLKDFFEKYPEQFNNYVKIDLNWNSNISEDEINFFKENIKISLDK